MIELISIHIPKTAGTSFQKVLCETYGGKASPAFRRRDIQPLLDDSGKLPPTIWQEYEVVHGHFRYKEISAVHKATGARVVCWLRHPVDRVISNYQFFRHRLLHPHLNPEVYALNEHRKDESLLTYAERDDNRNRMSEFLEGIALESIFFIGFQERFMLDLDILAKKLHWKQVVHARLNQQALHIEVDPVERSLIGSWNEKDMNLYHRALSLRDLSPAETKP